MESNFLNKHQKEKIFLGLKELRPHTRIIGIDTSKENGIIPFF